MEFMPFLNIDWTIIFMLGNTLILFLLMKKFFFEKVKAVIDAREEEVQGIYDEADKANQMAESLKADYEESLKGAKSEAAAIVGDAQKRAQVRADQIIDEAQAKSQAMLSKAEEEIIREKKKAINEIKDEISDMAVTIASKIVEKDINAKDHEALISSFIDGVGEV